MPILKRILLASTVLALSATAAVAADKEDTQVWGGLSTNKNSVYAFAGATHALNGDLAQDDYLLRIGAGHGWYEYDTAAFPGNDVDGRGTSLNVMFGYQNYFTPEQRVTVYVGPDFQHHRLSPNDLNNPTRGSEIGIKAQLEYISPITANWDFAGEVDVSSANNTYYSNLRTGYDSGELAFGPEVTFLGSESFDQQRVGAFLTGVQWGGIDVDFNGGYSWASRRGDDSVYAGIVFSNKF